MVTGVKIMKLENKINVLLVIFRRKPKEAGDLDESDIAWEETGEVLLEPLPNIPVLHIDVQARSGRLFQVIPNINRRMIATQDWEADSADALVCVFEKPSDNLVSRMMAKL